MVDQEAVLDAMRNVIDPELGIDVVELGMVGDIEIDGGDVIVSLHLTSMSCPFWDLFVDQVRTALSVVDGVEEASVRWDRRVAWSPELLSESARSQLEAVGLMPPRVQSKPADRGALLQLVNGVLSAQTTSPLRRERR